MRVTEKVLITGSTGTVGSGICTLLANIPGIEVRAGLHTQSKHTMLPSSVVAVPFDYERPETVDQAMRGVDKLFLTTPGGPLGPSGTKTIVDAAIRHNVKLIVKLSSIAPTDHPQVPTDLWALEAEKSVIDSGIPWVFIRPPWFNQNFTMTYFVPMVMARKLTLPFGEGRSAWVDTRDVAAIAVRALTEDGHVGKIYVPTGPELITLREIGQHLTDASRRKISYQHLSDKQWLAGAYAAGMNDEQGKATLALISKTRDGYHEKYLTNDVEMVTGKKSISFEQFAHDYSDRLASLAAMGMPFGEKIKFISKIIAYNFLRKR